MYMRTFYNVHALTSRNKNEGSYYHLAHKIAS